MTDWAKLTGAMFGLYNLGQAHRYGGHLPGTTLTRPGTTCRYPREADAVEDEA